MSVHKNRNTYKQPLLLGKRYAKPTISAEISSTSALYAEYREDPLDIDLEQHKTRKDNQSNDAYRDIIDSKCAWCYLCICCPVYLIWYLSTVCIAARCNIMFTMIISIVWTLMDEITDIIFIILLYTHFDSCSLEFYPYPYIIIGCISFNHVCNVLLSVIVRNNWCICDSMYHKTIPKCMQWFCLLSFGIFNCATFNDICKTYYLSQNRNNVVTIYMEQRLLCSQINIDTMNKLYAMEALSTKETFSRMLEKEAQIYPLLIFIQFCKTIPKLVVFAEITSIACVDTLHLYILTKLIMAIVSLVSEIKSCYISCVNAEFIEQFGDH